MAKIYNPSEFLKVNKLREIPLEKGVLAKFKEALLNNLPPQPDDDPESNYSNAVSPYFLLGKLNRDANDMNDAFYKELLYIIGLEEKSEKIVHYLTFI